MEVEVDSVTNIKFYIKDPDKFEIDTNIKQELFRDFLNNFINIRVGA